MQSKTIDSSQEIGSYSEMGEFKTHEEWMKEFRKGSRFTLKEAVIEGRRSINSDPAARPGMTMFFYCTKNGEMRGFDPFDEKYNYIAER